MPANAFVLGLLLAAAPLAAAQTRVSDAAGLRRAVAAAKPGDTILVAPGDYADNFHFRGAHGTAKAPIVVAAADPGKPPRFVGKRAPLHFSGASYLELKDLAITGSSGNGLNVDDAGAPDKPSHHITLRNLRV